MTIDEIKKAILMLIPRYPISRVVLFGSRAKGTNQPDSDVDLIVEFNDKVSLLTLARMKNELEEILGLDVDIIHGPIRETDMIEVTDEVELYAA